MLDLGRASSIQNTEDSPPHPNRGESEGPSRIYMSGVRSKILCGGMPSIIRPGCLMIRQPLTGSYCTKGIRPKRAHEQQTIQNPLPPPPPDQSLGWSYRSDRTPANTSLADMAQAFYTNSSTTIAPGNTYSSWCKTSYGVPGRTRRPYHAPISTHPRCARIRSGTLPLTLIK